MQSNKNFGELTFGFDIGIASVGWAVLGGHDSEPFMCIGVRAFDAAEDKDGKPNNQTRRGARVSRNRFEMLSWRLKQCRALFLEVGLLNVQEINSMFSAQHTVGSKPLNPWTLRSKALNEKLSREEWAQILYFLVKNRGFKFFSKKEDPREDLEDEKAKPTKVEDDTAKPAQVANDYAKKDERQGVKDGLLHIQALRAKYPQFKTVGELVYSLANAKENMDGIYFDANGNKLDEADLKEFKRAIRNKNKSYKHAFLRDHLVAELNLLFQIQAQKGNSFCNLNLADDVCIFENNQVQISSEVRVVERTFQANMFALMEMQHPPIYAEQMDALIGDCELESGKKRASKNTFSSERSSWLQMLNNLRIYRNGKEDRLSDEERAVLLSLPYTQSKLTFAQVREALRRGTGFPAQWRDASFNRVSYRSKRKSLNEWINIIKANGEVTSLNKYITDKNNKKQANKVLKEQSEKGRLNFAQLRKIFNVDENDVFEYVSKISEKTSRTIEASQEANEIIPIEYEDAQKNEDATFVELKGWHTLKRALAEKYSHFWQSLQIAWQAPLSADGKEKAGLIDEVAEILTKMQTDKEVADALKAKGVEQGVIEALQKVDFKGYKNLSLDALRKILPFLEQGKAYSEACNEAGYKKDKNQLRNKFLPKLETYLYERFRHGKKTGYVEKRFKDVNNPVVARAFSQARLVLNALIAEYGSPAYVHIELARDLAKSKKDRAKIETQQKDNRARRESRRSDFLEAYHYEPKDGQDLKLQLLDEQMQKCVYTLTELNRGLVIDDPNYAQIDHIWPRSKTWDSSLSNKVLVHAHANQNKSDRIPYEHILNDRVFGSTLEEREAHWHRVEKYIAGCHGMHDKKQQRVLAKVLDADEFLARNLVDTRYATRLFANMVRDKLLFAGQSADEKDIADIDAAESAKTRWEKYQKTRVRTPQGGVVAFLRGRWLGDKIKDREASDKHHAIDALIAAACTPALIHRVNTWFANEENQPRRFEKNRDGTWTDKSTGEVIDKDEARKRGLYLPAPWDEMESNSGGIFRKLFVEQYEQVFVSRMIKEKLNVKLHDANPMAWKQQKKMLRVRLYNLSIEQLDLQKLPENFLKRNHQLIEALRIQLEIHGNDSRKAFLDSFEFRGQKIRTIKLPVLMPQGTMSKSIDVVKKQVLNSHSAHKVVDLIDLKLEHLTIEKLGEQYYCRNDKLIIALVDALKKHGGKAEKAFPSSEFYPFGDGKNKKGNPYPLIRSIRLPNNKASGLFVRQGIAELGESLRTEVYLSQGKYSFKPIYKVTGQNILNASQEFNANDFLFSLTQNDLLRVTFKDETFLLGYFVCYEGDKRMQLRNHDQPKKEAHRFSVSNIKILEKYEVDVLGRVKEKGNGLA